MIGQRDGDSCVKSIITEPLGKATKIKPENLHTQELCGCGSKCTTWHYEEIF